MHKAGDLVEIYTPGGWRNALVLEVIRGGYEELYRVAVPVYDEVRTCPARGLRTAKETVRRNEV